MTMRCFKKSYVLIKASIFILCLVVFLLTASTVVRDYEQGLTNTVISHTNLNSTYMPQVTLCPVFFGQNGSFFTQSDVIADLSPNWIVTPTLTLYNGLCFSLTFNREVGPVDNLVYFFLKKDVQVIISEPGIEMWLVFAYFPYPISSFFIEIKDGVAAADVHLTKKESFILKECKNYDQDNSSYTQCAKKKLKATLEDKLNCTRTDFAVFNLSLPLCSSVWEKMKARYEVRSEIIKFVAGHNKAYCMDDCRRVTYDTRVNFFQNSFISHLRKSQVLVQLYFDSLLIETTREYLVYDAGRLLSTLGGSFGLFLGFSCFGILVSILNLLQNYFT